MQHRAMTGNYQRPDRSTPLQARNYHHLTLPASQSSATSRNLAKAITNEEFIAPARLPFIGTYPSQLEISKDEYTPVSFRTAMLKAAVIDTHQGAATAASTPWTSNQDRIVNYWNEPPYFSISRPWDQQFPDPKGTNPAYGDQAQTPLTVWESQAPIEEPFNNIGEVAMKPTQRQQDEPSDQNLRLGGRQTRGGG
jgi:hypothetical protein